jgi:hypothetical protein
MFDKNFIKVVIAAALGVALYDKLVKGLLDQVNI